MEETDIKRIELLTLDVKPGQVLIVRISGNPKPQDRQGIRDRLMELLPGVEVQFVSDAVDFTVIDAPADAVMAVIQRHEAERHEQLEARLKALELRLAFTF